MTMSSKWVVRMILVATIGAMSFTAYAGGDGDTNSGGSAIDQILSRAANAQGGASNGGDNNTYASNSDSIPSSTMTRKQLVQTELQEAKPSEMTPEELNKEADDYKLYPGATEALSDKAFTGVVRSTTPMTPDQIRLLHRMLDKSRRATAEPPGIPPKATSSSVLVNIAPGATPPVVRLRDGYVTSVVFIDATGQPWPIQAYDLGNPKRFNIHWDQKGNTLMIQANSDYLEGNLAVMLRGLNTPIMVTLIPGQQAVDYRVDMRIPRLGPHSVAAGDTLPDTADPRLLDVLDGIPPTGAKQLRLSMVGSDAWLQGNTMFLRTPLSVLSPSWTATVRSDDGMHAYELQPTPVILVMQRGKITKLTVKGF